VRLGPKLSEGFRDGPGELVRPMLLSLAQLAAELNPSPQTFTRVGAALRQNGRHKESVPMFEEAAELEPSAKAYTYCPQSGAAAPHAPRAGNAPNSN
jgi:hypothetical protein